MGFLLCFKYLFLLMTGLLGAHGDTYNVDMDNTGVCTSVTPVLVGPYDVYNIYAEPAQDGRGVRDKCTVRFYSSNGQKFKLFVRDLLFRECQIFVRFYDGDRYLQTPRYSFGCNSATGNLLKSYSTDVAVSLEKPDATSTGYKFYFRLALDSGPDIGGEGNGVDGDDSGMSTGIIVGIIVAVFLVVAVGIAVTLYCLYVYRRKKEEKEMALTRSRSTLFGNPTTVRDDSVHSSKHSLHSTHSTHSTHFTKDTSQFSYPAFRTKPSISEKGPQCNSIDTKSFDSDAIDEADNPLKPILVKDVKNEFRVMKKGLQKEERRQQRDAEDLRMQERRWNETRQADRKNREESNRGLGRSNRSRDNRMVLNEENIRRSSRADRHRGRSYDDNDNRIQRNSRAGSSRSTRTRDRDRSRGHSPARSGGAWSEPDYISRHRERSPDRGRERSRNASRRSHSSGTQSRRKRDYYDDERDTRSDYDYGYRSSSRDRSNSHRSGGTHRSHSSSRHHR